MAKKFLAAVLAAVILAAGVAYAEKIEVPQSKRLKIFIEVSDATNFSELQTAEILRDKLIAKFKAKNIFIVLNPTVENFLADIKTLEPEGAADIGDFVTFPTKNPELELDNYQNADFVIQCEILGVGLAREKESDFGFGSGVGIGIGNGGFGLGIGSGSTMRQVYCTAVSVQILDVARGTVRARHNSTAQAFKHSKPHKGYNDTIDEAYLKSLDNTADSVYKRVLSFAAKKFPQYAKVSK